MTTAFGRVSSLLNPPAPSPDGGTRPIRDAIFSLERLEQHANELAAEHRLTVDSRRGRGLSKRLRDNARVLLAANRTILRAARAGRPITHAAEWLVDNFYVVDEQLREIAGDLPPGFYRGLPKLASGVFAHYPRVFALSWAFVTHSDSRFDTEALTRFIAAYQRTHALEIGELWALPITLRIVLVENLRRSAELVVAARAAREQADAFADDLLGLNGYAPQPLEAMRARFRGRASLPQSFVVQLTQRLREQGDAALSIMALLEARLSEQGLTPDALVANEYAAQTGANVTVRNIITSMRLISALDWALFFESLSAVDVVLNGAQGFSESDFATRDQYRHVIEKLARGSRHSEVEIAEFALRLSADTGAAPPEDIGFALTAGRGLQRLERIVGFRPTALEWLLRVYRAGALPGYLGTVTLTAWIVVALGVAWAAPQATPLEWVLLALLALIPASDLALALVNNFVTSTFRPRLLAKLDLKDGVPTEWRTVVAVPTLLTAPALALEELERLEVRYLANSTGDLRFALLGDFADAALEVMPGDEIVLSALFDGLRALNERYSAVQGGGERFYVFYRRRQWSASERVWMGWERKRGKLHEFNRLLRGATDTSFSGLTGAALEVPSDVKFVITLDADTRLPRGAACHLVGALAHPLNRPQFDALGRVTAGYAVLQPRITLSLPNEREGTVFQSVYSSHAGMDPYASAVSDVYQDLFGEGSYAGKGIYDVDAFETALAGRVPETALLSHDLFEGLFARAGLVSDVELVEEYPSHYLVRSARQHRWVRGDWQLLPWVFSGRAPVSVIGRWKLLDNLRRSLTPVALVAALLAGWLLGGVGALEWTVFLLATLAIPALLPFLKSLIPTVPGASKRSLWLEVMEKLSLGAAQFGLGLTFLADGAWQMLDAILRTLTRVFVTRQNLLEWRTAAQVGAGANLELRGFYRAMLGAVGLSVAVAGLTLWLRPASWWIALPFVTLWLLSPLVARWASSPEVSQPLEPLAGTDQASADQAGLRLYARRTWRYFERFVSPDDHHLPPDNYQENPQPLIAHRTSPTNIGLGLLSTVSAHDFGWIGLNETTERLELMLASTMRLERYRGHLYNWYDTQTLQPLEPRYVSTVDSGNLAGHLIALAQTCLELTTQPISSTQTLNGITDALRLARVAATQATDPRSKAGSARPLESALKALEDALGATPVGAAGLADRLEALSLLAETLNDVAVAFVIERGRALKPEIGSELTFWAAAVRSSILSHRRDFETLLPWARLEGFDAAPLTLQNALELGAFVAAPSAATLELLEQGKRQCATLKARLEVLATQSQTLVHEMEFGFLFDDVKKLFSIGLNGSTHHLDPSFYDLLASEARLLSFVAIAKDDVPTSHWFHLSRELTPVGLSTALVSWSGSMFEYLMPRLVMRSPPGSLLFETGRRVVQAQIAYSAKRSAAKLPVPWGISESAFAARDLALNYQYLAFGVPGLGLKRGLSDDLVIAPYATALAAMVDVLPAARNFDALERIGALGAYGFYDAIDFTPSRVPEGSRFVIVKNFMAHHQGMTITALGNVLLGDRMTARFHADPRVQAAELLLQERTPRDAAVARPRSDEVAVAAKPLDDGAAQDRHFESLVAAATQTHLLSNGQYSVLLTGAGGGYSRVGDLAVTRWREDATRDTQGSFIYLRALPLERGADERIWSATPQPLGLESDRYSVSFFEDRAEYLRRDDSFETRLEIIVSAEDNAEMRRVSVTNHTARVREVELTSYMEVVLSTPAADDSHPAFSKLFVQTEFVPGSGALLATRRSRSPSDAPIWAAHAAVIEGVTLDGGTIETRTAAAKTSASRDSAARGFVARDTEPRASREPLFETDRMRFLGRGADVTAPAMVVGGTALSGTTGAVLDPIFSLRRRVRLEPGATARVTFTTLTAASRELALELIDRHDDADSFERGLMLAWTRAQVQLRHLGTTPLEAQVYQRLAGRLAYFSPDLRPVSEVLLTNTLGQTGLWRHGISGDLPIVLLRIDDLVNLEIVRELLRAKLYWRTKGFRADVVILNEQPTSYVQALQEAIESVARAVHVSTASTDGVFTLRSDLLSREEVTLLRSTARAVLLGRLGTLAEQVARTRTPVPRGPPPRLSTARRVTAALGSLIPTRRSSVAAPSNAANLEFYNGLGGFAADGTEYVIELSDGQRTPAPWINVIANAALGCTVSEQGSGYTWAGNSREFKLTPWSNDPVSDPPGEVIYIRDEETFEVFTATPLPMRDDSSGYQIRHGQGYTTFLHDSHGLHLELTIFVAQSDPVKISRLTIENRSNRPRRLSVTAYLEWVLGASREVSAPHVTTEVDPVTGAMIARNRWSEEFAQIVSFADLVVQWGAGKGQRLTGDRTEFIGRLGHPSAPVGLEPGSVLSGRVGAGLDPCAALQTTIELGIGARSEVAVILGSCDNLTEAQRLIGAYRNADIGATFEGVKRGWAETLDIVQVSTPDRAFDIMLNRWLPYQTLSSRVLGRTGFYQAGGAYGFRDQLQDTMAISTMQPKLARELILRSASRQFLEGDVQHWWHPPSGRGVRTRISDDRLWLPYAVSHYLTLTGDAALLDEAVGFIEGPPLADGVEDSYYTPTTSALSASLFEHGARAIDCSLAVGAHGLPLIGSGDWNDGMNRVGQHGKGESVWLAWFLHANLGDWALLADARGEAARAANWRNHAIALQHALETHGWDGQWYRRAFYDDGEPLGSAQNAECRIDSIAQSWAVMSGAGDPIRAMQAMAAVETQLVRREDQLILLFTPPFDNTPHDPGYIKGYLPGVRENGGQYTHAAVWAVIASAQLGDGNRAFELFAMLNPISHTNTRAAVQRYKTEPYVLAADVYAAAPHVGRGGWTWYTGSSGWLYRAGLESILGFGLRGDRLHIDPCIPASWKQYRISFKYRSSQYEITVHNPRGATRGVTRLELDGVLLTTTSVELKDDGHEHRICVELG